MLELYPVSSLSLFDVLLNMANRSAYRSHDHSTMDVQDEGPLMIETYLESANDGHAVMTLRLQADNGLQADNAMRPLTESSDTDGGDPLSRESVAEFSGAGDAS